MKFDCELNYGSGWVLSDPPMNIGALEDEINWTGQFFNSSVSGLDFQWDKANAINLAAYFNAGTTGGKGISEGVGCRFYVWAGVNNSQRQLFLDGYIETSSARWECDIIHAKVVETGKQDWFVNKCKSIPFRYLAKLPVGSQGRIVPATDYKRTPYCLTKYSQAPLQEALMAVLELSVVKQGEEAFKDISSLIAKAGGDAATAAATLGAATPTVVATITEIGFDAAYLAASTTTIILEIKKVIDAIWQSKKYKLCMLERTLWLRVCQHLGMQFSSTIYAPTSKHYNETWMPKKNQIPNPAHPLTNFFRHYDESVGFPNNPNVWGHYDGLASDFIATMCDKYNAQVNIQLNPTTGIRTVYFEEKHHWNTQAVLTIQNANADGYTHNEPDPFETNLTSLPWNLIVSFATDETDEGTLARYAGTCCEKTVQQTVVGNRMWTSRGIGKNVSLECARALRKDYLNKVETLINDILNVLIGVVNAILNAIAILINSVIWIINLFGGNINPVTAPQLPTNILNNRLGWMELSDDKFTLPKSFIGVQSGSDWLISAANITDCTGQSLMIDFHQKELPTHGAQQKIYRDKKIQFCLADYLAVRNRNVITTPSGGLGNLIKLKWKPEDNTALVDYGIYKVVSTNLTEKTFTDEQ